MEEQTPALVAEQLEIGKRTVETARVRFATRVVETEQVVEQPVRRDAVEIERVSVNRAVDQPSPPRHEGDVTIFPVYEEVLVVTRQLMLKEELRITRRSTLETAPPQRFSLRHEELEIIRNPAGKPD